MVTPTLDEYASKYSHVEFHREDGVLEMQLHSDGEDLVWGFSPHEELGHCFADVGADPENEVIILTGTGETFIDQGDLAGTEVDAESWARVIEAGKRLQMNLLDIPMPMIAAINGPATRHAELGVLCDIVLAADNATFQDSGHLPNGLLPGDGVHIVWPLLLGMNRGRYFLLTGETLSAQEAHDLGVVNEVMPREELLPRARELAELIKSRSDLTVRLTREAVLQHLKSRMQDELGYGLALEGLAALDHWPHAPE